MNIAQIKQDLDKGVIVSAATWRELVEWAVKVEGESTQQHAPAACNFPLCKSESEQDAIATEVHAQIYGRVQGAMGDDVMRALRDARTLAMNNCAAARLPESADFGAIAQNLDWALNQIDTSKEKP